MGTRLSTLVTLTFRALLRLGEPSPRNPPTSDIPCRLQAPPSRIHPVRAGRMLRLRDRTRLTPTILRTPTRPTNACALFGSSEPDAFRRRSRRRPAWPEPHLLHPSEGMTQPRLGTSSTVSTDHELTPVLRNALCSDLNDWTPRTPFHRRIWP